MDRNLDIGILELIGLDVLSRKTDFEKVHKLKDEHFYEVFSRAVYYQNTQFVKLVSRMDRFKLKKALEYKKGIVIKNIIKNEDLQLISLLLKKVDKIFIDGIIHITTEGLSAYEILKFLKEGCDICDKGE